MTERVWEIRVGVHCTEDRMHDLRARIQLLLCPDPDHAPPCLIPWSTSYRQADDEDYPAVVEQARIEKPS